MRFYLLVLILLVSSIAHGIESAAPSSGGFDLQNTGKISNAVRFDGASGVITNVSATAISTNILNVTGQSNITNLNISNSLTFTQPIIGYYQPSSSNQVSYATDFFNFKYASSSYFQGVKYSTLGWYNLGYLTSADAYVIYKVSTKNISDITIGITFSNYADGYTHTWQAEYSYNLNDWNLLGIFTGSITGAFKTYNNPSVYIRMKNYSTGGGSTWGSSLIGLTYFSVVGASIPSATITTDVTDTPGLLVTGKTLIGTTVANSTEVLSVSGGEYVKGGLISDSITSTTCTANTFIDLTPGFEGDALAEISKIRNKADGTLNHDTIGSTAITRYVTSAMYVVRDKHSKEISRMKSLPIVIKEVTKEELVPFEEANSVVDPTTIKDIPTYDNLSADKALEFKDGQIQSSTLEFHPSYKLKPGFIEKNNCYYKSVISKVVDSSTETFLLSYPAGAVLETTIVCDKIQERDIGMEISRLNKAFQEQIVINEELRNTIESLKGK